MTAAVDFPGTTSSVDVQTPQGPELARMVADLDSALRALGFDMSLLPNLSPGLLGNSAANGNPLTALALALGPQGIANLTAMVSQLDGNLGEAQISKLADQLGWPVDMVKQALAKEERNGTLVSSNPALNSIIRLAVLCFNLGIKVEKQSFELIQMKLEKGNKAAEEAFQGALKNFYCEMAAGAVMGAMGVASIGSALRNHYGNGKSSNSMWIGPIGVQVITSPITAGGNFAQADGQRYSQLAQNQKEELGDFLSQMMMLLEKLNVNNF